MMEVIQMAIDRMMLQEAPPNTNSNFFFFFFFFKSLNPASSLLPWQGNQFQLGKGLNGR